MEGERKREGGKREGSNVYGLILPYNQLPLGSREVSGETRREKGKGEEVPTGTTLHQTERSGSLNVEYNN